MHNEERRMLPVRKYWIDFLRVISVMGVVCIHCTVEYYMRFGIISDRNWWIANVVNACSRFSVPMFVMISGCVLLGKVRDIKSFYRERTSRLIPPFLVWNIFYLLINYVNGGEIWKIIKDTILMGHAYYHLWYLTMFVFLMLFAPFLNSFVHGERPSNSGLLILICVIFTLYFLRWFSDLFASGDIHWFIEFIYFMGYFLGGYVADQVIIRKGNLTRLMIAIIAFFSALAIVGNYISCKYFGINMDWFVASNWSPIVAPICFALFIAVKQSDRLLPRSKLLDSLGEASFGIFLIHPFWLWILNGIFPRRFSYGTKYMLVSIPVVFIASYLSIFIIRKSSLGRRIC